MSPWALCLFIIASFFLCTNSPTIRALSPATAPFALSHKKKIFSWASKSYSYTLLENIILQLFRSNYIKKLTQALHILKTQMLHSYPAISPFWASCNGLYARPIKKLIEWLKPNPNEFINYTLSVISADRPKIYNTFTNCM